MRVLIACEESGVVRNEFAKLGHDAWSCDTEPTRIPGNHYQMDVISLFECYPYSSKLGHYWDLIIAHPPCDYLTVAGNRWYSDRPDLYIPAYKFAKMFMDYADKVCVENPVGRLSTLWRKPDQYIHPWQFGHGETKKTGLWLKNLPLLVPTNIVEGREQKVWKMGPSETRKRDRSETYLGIAKSMAEQWG